MNEEKSAFDIINNMHAMILTMSQTMAIMDRNIKILNDKANGALFPNAADIITKLTPIQKTIFADLEQPSQVGVPQEQTKMAVSEDVGHTQKQNIKVESKVISADKKPIHGIKVNIFNSTNNLVKGTTTNRAGMWMSYLPPGKYTVKYEHNGTIIQTKNIELKEGQDALKI